MNVEIEKSLRRNFKLPSRKTKNSKSSSKAPLERSNSYTTFEINRKAKKENGQSNQIIRRSKRKTKRTLPSNNIKRPKKNNGQRIRRSRINPNPNVNRRNNRPMNKDQRVKKFSGLLNQAKTKHVVGMNRRVGYDTPMPFIQPIEQSRGSDRLRLTGSEFITTISVHSSVHGTPTEPGDIIYNLPISPSFLPGTRIAQLARLYQKYKYMNLTFEYVPIVPSIQDGALLMYVVEDPNENPTLQVDPDVRLRIDMAHKGAHMFNVYTYGRCFLTHDTDAYDWYYIYNTDEPRLNNQGQLFISAASTYTNEAEEITLGQIIMHYDIEFEARTMNNAEPGPTFVEIEFTGEEFQLIFGDTTQGQPYNLYGSANLGAFEDIIYIFRITETFTQNSVTLTCNTELGDAIPFFAQGSVWYGTCESTGTRITIYPSLDDALSDHSPATLTSNITGTNPLVGAASVTLYPRNINL